MISILKKLKEVLRGGASDFNDFEKKLLASIEAALPEEVRHGFRARVEAVNLVQRPAGTEVNCYVMRSGKSQVDEAHRITRGDDALCIASFRVKSGEKLVASGAAYAVKGVFFSLEFNLREAGSCDSSAGLSFFAENKM
jgi:hypothetical protein